MEKICRKCYGAFPATNEYFYPYAPKRDHPHGGFQPYCKCCWKTINAENKKRLKDKRNDRAAS